MSPSTVLFYSLISFIPGYYFGVPINFNFFCIAQANLNAGNTVSTPAGCSPTASPGRMGWEWVPPQPAGKGKGICQVPGHARMQQGKRLGADLPTVSLRQGLTALLGWNRPWPRAEAPAVPGQGHQGMWVHSGPKQIQYRSAEKKVPTNILSKLILSIRSTWYN